MAESVEFNRSSVRALMSTDGVLPAPIDLDMASATPLWLENLKWTNLEEVPTSMKLVNNGEVVVVSAWWKAGRQLTISGGPLGDCYVFTQLHLHWDSEHTVQGMRGPLEQHAVFFNARYDSQEAALQSDDGIIIVVHLGMPREQTSPGLRQVIRQLPAITEPRTSVHTPVAPLSTLLTPFCSDYLVYWGSVAGKACRHSVLWLISPDPIFVSSSDLRVFRTLRQKRGKDIVTYERLGRSVFLANPSRRLIQAFLKGGNTPLPVVEQKAAGDKIDLQNWRDEAYNSDGENGELDGKDEESDSETEYKSSGSTASLCKKRRDGEAGQEAPPAAREILKSNNNSIKPLINSETKTVIRKTNSLNNEASVQCGDGTPQNTLGEVEVRTKVIEAENNIENKNIKNDNDYNNPKNITQATLKIPETSPYDKNDIKIITIGPENRSENNKHVVHDDDQICTNNVLDNTVKITEPIKYDKRETETKIIENENNYENKKHVVTKYDGGDQIYTSNVTEDSLKIPESRTCDESRVETQIMELENNAENKKQDLKASKDQVCNNNITKYILNMSNSSACDETKGETKIIETENNTEHNKHGVKENDNDGQVCTNNITEDTSTIPESRVTIARRHTALSARSPDKQGKEKDERKKVKSPLFTTINSPAPKRVVFDERTEEKDKSFDHKKDEIENPRLATTRERTPSEGTAPPSMPNSSCHNRSSISHCKETKSKLPVGRSSRAPSPKLESSLKVYMRPPESLVSPRPPTSPIPPSRASTVARVVECRKHLTSSIPRPMTTMPRVSREAIQQARKTRNNKLPPPNTASQT